MHRLKEVISVKSIKFPVNTQNFWLISLAALEPSYGVQGLPNVFPHVTFSLLFLQFGGPPKGGRES